MQCNSSGLSNATRGAQFGILSYDWSNNKKEWAAAAPMDCEEELLAQAESTKKAAEATPGSNTHVFVYRNVVKALPWFSSVRTILLDPHYSGFFLKFKDETSNTSVPRCAAENKNKCSMYYHDQLQTPEVPTTLKPHPDGSCDPKIGCDCGEGLPCGEYLWDHRNGTQLRNWLLEHHILSSTVRLLIFFLSFSWSLLPLTRFSTLFLFLAPLLPTHRRSALLPLMECLLMTTGAPIFSVLKIQPSQDARAKIQYKDQLKLMHNRKWIWVCRIKTLQILLQHGT